MALSPPHYGSNWAVGDFIREQDLGFHRGNAIKYIARAGKKDSAIDDLKKAIHYLENEIEFLESPGKGIQKVFWRPEWSDSPKETEEFDR